MTTHDRCPVCSGTDIHEVFRVKDFTVSGTFFPVWHCNQCSARFTQDIPGDLEIGAYYQSEEYVSHSDTKKGLINKLYHAVRKITLSSKRKMVTSALPQIRGNILDYGCGTGAFLREMQSAGWQITGLEPDTRTRNIAGKLVGQTIYPPTYINSISENLFDAITLWHVLEHVHLLHQTLKQLNRVLKPGGHIFIAVPNYTSQDAIKYQADWAAWDVPRHLYHFSPESIKKLLPRHGFKLTEIHPMWFDSIYVSMLSEKYKTGKTHHFRALLNGLSSNFHALQNKEECSSLIYVAVKE